MPFCAYCRWEYSGTPRYCRECGRPILRRRAAAEHPAPASAASVGPRLTPASRDGLLFLGGLIGGLAFLLPGVAGQDAVLSGFPLDEAWVRLVYARSLASEARLAFNPGPSEAAVSSLLWVGLMALLIKTLGAAGLSVVAMAKGVSLLAGAAAVVLTGRLATRLVGSTAFGLLVGLLVAADPGFGFASASGVEVTLFAALAVGACAALAGRRWQLTGLLLALATLTRFEGVVLAGVVGAAAAALAVDRLRRRRAGGDLLSARQALVGLGLVLPSLLAFGLWGWLDGTAQDGAWPRPLALALAAGPGLDFAAPGALWRGYLASSVWALTGPAAAVAVALLGLGAWLLARAHPRLAAPIVAFPLLAALGAALVVEAAPPWGFEQRRLLDPVRPFLALLYGLGVLALSRLSRAWCERWPRESARGALVVGGGLVAALLPLAGLAPVWARLPAEYTGSARALQATYFELAIHARENLPPDALLVALQPGTLRYVSRRPVADARGLHTRGLPRLPLYESWPPAALVREFGAAPGPTGPALGFYRVTPGATASPRDGLYAFPLDTLRRLDYLDVGSEAAERSHQYGLEGPRGTTRVSLRVTPDHAVDDDGRAFVGAESFEVAAEPNRDLVLARRFEASGAVLLVTIDGQPAGEWRSRSTRYAVAEDTLRIGAGLIRRARVQVKLELVDGSAPRALSFGYWSFTDR